MNQVLYIFAENFSNDTRESFFEKELPYLSRKFGKIYVVPLYPDASALSFSAGNVEVLNFNFFQPCNRINVLLANFFPILRLWLYELMHTHHKGFYIKKFRANLNDLLYKFSAARKLEALIAKDINASTVFYSYWFMQWMMALSIIKMRHPDMKLVSRVHGADYDEEQVKRPLPFRYFQLSKVNRIFSVSAFAKQYLEKRFKLSPVKTEVSRLGLLLDEALSPIDVGRLHVVSCSSLIPLKRVELIVDILSHLSGPVTWTHFGDGPLLDSVKKKSNTLPGNVTCEFKGYVSNKDFLNYLRNNSVSLFMNVSESEGIPVTMMEAISFGIPVLGTAVCGVPEIVTEATGILVPKDFDAKQLASFISDAHQTGKLYSEAFRKNIRQFYKDYFYAPLNHGILADKLTTL